MKSNLLLPYSSFQGTEEDFLFPDRVVTPRDFGAIGKANRTNIPGGFVRHDVGLQEPTQAAQVSQAAAMPPPEYLGDMGLGMDEGTASGPVDIRPEAMGGEPSDPSNMSTSDILKNWMNRKSTGKALMGFAAGMLSGNGFNDGLARGLKGYQSAVDSEEAKQSLTPAQMQELALKARLKAAYDRKTGSDGKWRKVETIARDGKQYSVLFNDTTGEYREEPLNGMRATDSGERTYNSELAKDDVEYYTAFRNSASSAPERYQRYERAYNLVDTAGVGKDWLTQGANTLAEGLNYEILGISPADADEYRQIVRRMELDASKIDLKGQGQVTEFERKIIQEALAGKLSNPESAKRFFKVMMEIERRKTEKNQAWLEAKVRARREGYSLNFRDWEETEWNGYLNTIPDYTQNIFNRAAGSVQGQTQQGTATGRPASASKYFQ